MNLIRSSAKENSFNCTTINEGQPEWRSQTVLVFFSPVLAVEIFYDWPTCFPVAVVEEVEVEDSMRCTLAGCTYWPPCQTSCDRLTVI